MSFVLVEGAVITCVHGGACRLPGPGSTALTVSKAGVLLAGAEAGFAFGSAAAPVPGMITPCPAALPNGQPQPCVTTPTRPAGLTTKLTVAGQPALLDAATGDTMSGAGKGAWTITDPGQQILEAS
ncbi:hypothetical protein [Kitasatospora sp. CB02891]|uniref:hypothetical protein n=1 Tax=Kitasatospora sp. CB02891 TaxID=2020329 RepID=UPI0012FE3F36|nr:hypothetical protein [Kitasatospora sp. CB02891]